MSENRNAFERLLLSSIVPERWGSSILGDLDEEWSRKRSGKPGKHLWYLYQVMIVAGRFLWERLRTRFRQPSRKPPGKSTKRRKRRLPFASALLPDLRYAFRGLYKSPGFTAIAVIIMGLGIGANTAIFTIVNALLFNSLPYKDVSNIVQVYQSTPDSPRPQWISYPDFLDFRDRSELFADAAAVSDGVPLSILTDEGTDFVIGEAYSADLFSILDIPPVLGRSFLLEENERGSEPVAMMSYAEWQRKYGGRSDIIGQTVRINGYTVTIIGIGPEGYQGTLGFIAADYWLSWGTADAIEPYLDLDQRDGEEVRMIARLRPSVTVGDARTRLETLSANLAQEYPETHAESKAVVMPAAEVRIDPSMDSASYPISAFLMTIVGLVLVVACSNLAGLLLTRATSRQKEIAVRLSLGASRGRLVGLLLTESVLLGLLGGTFGLLVASWTADAIVSYQPPFPFALSLNLQLDEKVLAFNLMLSVATGLFFGLAPALKASRADLVKTMKNETASFGVGRGRFTLRNVFVVAQVALSLVLLIGAGLFIRTVLNTSRVDAGFDADGTAVAVFDVSRAGYETGEDGRSFIERYRQAVASSPGVEAVALTTRIPYGLWNLDKTPVHLPGDAIDAEVDLREIDFAAVDEGYFETMGIPIVRGRGIGVEDTESSRRVAVVGESMARQFWGSLDVIGETVVLGPVGELVQAEVVGVSGDIFFRSKRTAREEHEPFLYMPFTQRYSPTTVLVAKTKGDPAALPETFRRELKGLDYRVPLFEAKTMEEHMSINLYVPRMSAYLLLSFGSVAMVLAGIGLYGLIAFSVTRRTREVGIRIALGAQANQVVGMILKEGVGLVATGLIVGMLIAALITQPLSTRLMGVSPLDPLTYAVVAMMLFGVTALAVFIPARRAAKSDPMAALRHE